MNWRQFLPILDVRIAVPFATVHTEIMVDNLETQQIIYLKMYIRLFVWHFSFKLYDIDRRKRG